MALYAIARRTAAVSAVGTSWGAFVSDGSWDVTVDAAAGDVIELGLNAVWNPAAVYRNVDIATIVSGSVVNWVSTGTGSHTGGIDGLFQGNTNDYMPVSGDTYYTVQSGDVSSGQVTFRVYGKVSSGTLALLSSSTALALFWASKVVGSAPVSSALSGSVGTSWAAFTGSVTIAAAAGDVLKLSISAFMDPGNLTAIDAATIVSSSPVNWVSSASGTHSGSVGAWRCALGVYEPVGGGGILYTVQAGDISGGNVTFKVYGLTVASTRPITGTLSVRKVA